MDPNTTDERTEQVLGEIRGVRDALTVHRVFGDPVHVDGVTLVPVARLSGGGGGGGGEGTDAEESGSGFGTGFGLSARGLGVYEVRDGTATWKPAVDVDRVIRGGQVLAGVVLVGVTLVALARVRRAG